MNKGVLPDIGARQSDMEEKNDRKSLIMIITSMAVFGTIGIFRKMIPLSSAWVAFFRGGIGSIFLLLFLCAKSRIGGKVLSQESSAESLKPAQRSSSLEACLGMGRKTLILLVISGAIIGLNWQMLFEAYNYTSVSVATLCYYMEPTIVIILSCVIFREKMTLAKAVCAASALFGMVLVSGVIESGGISASDGTGMIYGLISAAMYSTVVMMNKSIKACDPYVKTLIQLIAATLVLVPYLALHDGAPTGLDDQKVIVLLLIVGIIHTGISYVMYFGSMDGLHTQTVALMSYIDPVTALILSALLLGERLTVFGIIGAVLIIGSAVIFELFGEKK